MGEPAARGPVASIWPTRILGGSVTEGSGTESSDAGHPCVATARSSNTGPSRVVTARTRFVRFPGAGSSDSSDDRRPVGEGQEADDRRPGGEAASASSRGGARAQKGKGQGHPADAGKEGAGSKGGNGGG